MILHSILQNMFFARIVCITMITMKDADHFLKITP